MRRAQYEPELFPGLGYKMTDDASPNASEMGVVIMFASGKINITGVRTLRAMYRAFLNVYPIAKLHHKGALPDTYSTELPDTVQYQKWMEEILSSTCGPAATCGPCAEGPDWDEPVPKLMALPMPTPVPMDLPMPTPMVSW